MKRLRTAAAIAAFLTVLAIPGAAQASGGAGELTDATGSVEIEVNVADANSYLDGAIAGTGSFTAKKVSPGLHRLTVVRDGYYVKAMTIRVVAGETTKVSVTLIPITGTLEVAGVPPRTAFSVTVGERDYASTRVELAEGEWDVTVRAFGYRDMTSRVRVTSGQTVTVAYDAVPAEFAAGGLSVSRRTFNPDDPELLGAAVVSFTVTAPGAGSLKIRDGSGSNVRTIALKPFDSWKQRVAWDGTDDAGEPLPDGVYPLSVSVASADGQTALDLVSNAVIDRSARFPIAGTDGGGTSTGPVASATLMGARSIRFDAGASAFAGTFGADMSLVAGLADGLEAGARFGAATDGGERSAFDVALSLAAGTRVGEIAGAASLGWRARTARVAEDAGKYRNGIRLSLPVECRAGAVSVGLAPSVSYGNDLGFPAGGYFTAGMGAYARAGLGSAFVGVCANADSVAFGGSAPERDFADGSALGPVDAWSAGADARFVVPETSVILSLEGGYAKSARARGGAYVSGGVGIAF